MRTLSWSLPSHENPGVLWSQKQIWKSSCAQVVGLVVVLIMVMVMNAHLPMILIVPAWLWPPGWQDSHPLVICTCILIFQKQILQKVHISCIVCILSIWTFDLNLPLCLDKVHSCDFREPTIKLENEIDQNIARIALEKTDLEAVHILKRLLDPLSLIGLFLC